MTHSINKQKVEEELTKRGWRRGRYSEWLIPDIDSFATIEEDWTAAILAGIVCSHEVSKKKTEDFIKKHPTPRR